MYFSHLFIKVIKKIAWIYVTHLFYVIQNVILNVSKYNKFTENNPQDMRDLSKQINTKFRSRVKKFCHTSNNLIIGSNVHVPDYKGTWKVKYNCSKKLILAVVDCECLLIINAFL